MISSNLLQASDPLSHFILWQLHLNIYVLLEDVGPCSPSSASSDTTSPQFGPPSFQGKDIFRQGFSKTFAKLSRKITQSFLQNETYTLNNKYIHTTYIYNANLDMSTWTFAKTLARKKNSFAISEKNFSRDCSLHTQRLTQRKPLSWTFCSTLMCFPLDTKSITNHWSHSFGYRNLSQFPQFQPMVYPGVFGIWLIYLKEK